MGNKVKPTKQQAKAMELIREGVKPTRAMKKAGYSKYTSTHPRENLLQAASVQSIIEQYKAEYTQVGITPQYMARKAAEWLEAQKQISARNGGQANAETDDFIEVPDYQTQLKAAEMVRKDWKMGEDDGFSEEATFTWKKK